MENQIQCTKCGSSNYRVELRNIHKTAYCNSCDSYIKNIPQGLPQKLYFGKFKERLISSMNTKEEVDYLKWLIANTKVKPNALKEAIDNHLDNL